jgi:hypothetical protein
MGYYAPMGPGAHYYAAAAAATAPPAMVYPRGRGGFFPGGKNWAGARPPPPGQPGFSSGLQVRHGLAGRQNNRAHITHSTSTTASCSPAADVGLAAIRPGCQRSHSHLCPRPRPALPFTLQVVVHNLPWDCTWQQLKDAFNDCGEIERADVVFDSRGRSRCAARPPACLPACSIFCASCAPMSVLVADSGR